MYNSLVTDLQVLSVVGFAIHDSTAWQCNVQVRQEIKQATHFFDDVLIATVWLIRRAARSSKDTLIENASGPYVDGTRRTQ